MVLYEAIALAHDQVTFLLGQVSLNEDNIVSVQLEVDLICSQLDSAFVILKDYERRLVNEDVSRILALSHRGDHLL